MTTDDLLAEFARRGVHRTGHFRLSSGLHSDTYLQCARALQDPAFALDLGTRLAGRLRESNLARIDVVVSPAIGGLLAGFAVATALRVRFVFTERQDGAMTLRRGQDLAAGESAVVVEDVLTTGGSANEAATVVAGWGADVVSFAALVDRSGRDHPLPFAATALLRVDARTFEPDACPLCAAGTALDAPGSRYAAPPASDR